MDSKWVHFFMLIGVWVCVTVLMFNFGTVNTNNGLLLENYNNILRMCGPEQQ